MALTIQKQPATIILSGNPAELVISSNTVVNSNHKIHVRLYKYNETTLRGDLLGEEALPVINNSASFDISDYLKEESFFNLTIFDLFDVIPQKYLDIPRFYFICFETYDGTGIEYNAITSSYIYAINGGFANLYLQNYNSENKTFFQNFLTTDKKFLTWSPVKKITWNQHDFLFFVSLSTGYYSYKITITFNDTSTQEISSNTNRIYSYKINYINTSILANKLDSYETEDKKIVSYTVQVFISGAVTEARTYYVDRNTYNFGRQFIFRNSLGAYDIIYLKGISQQTNELQRTIGYYQSKEINTFSEFNETYKAASGFIINNYSNSALARQYVIEFINSREIYEIVGKNIVEITPENSKIKINQDDEFLFSFMFEYRYSKNDLFFAPIDTEQYLNPRIFYRNGDIPDVAPGQLATVNFDVFINTNATVNFTLSWGVDIGTTYLNGVDLIEDVTESLTDSITIPGNVSGPQLLTIYDNLGGRYYIPFNVVDNLMLFNDGEQMLFNDNEEMNYN